MSPEWFEWLRKNIPPHMFEAFERDRIHGTKWRDDEISRLQSALSAEQKRREEAERELEMLRQQREILNDELAASQKGKHKSRADNAMLREALDNLQKAESAYRMAHDVHGDMTMKSGRAWDLMRRAGDEARAVLDHEPGKGGISALCAGCAYNNDSLVLRTNCVGCMGFDDRPHKVAGGPDAPDNWWEAKPEKEGGE